MSKLYEFDAGSPTPGESCPPPALWGELAAGLMTQEEAFKHLQHAGGCSSCSEELQYALYAVGDDSPAPEEIRKHLATTTEEWQRRAAEKIAAGKPPFAPDRTAPLSGRLGHGLRSLLSFPWPIAVVAAVALLGIGMSAFFWLHRSSADKLIREAYAQHRTVEMRIPGAGYGPLRSAGAYRGPPDSSPQSLLEAQAMIKRGLEKTPDNAELLRQKAEADLLSWNFPEAMETLKRAAGIRPDAFALHADLAIAYFERAEAGANPADYEAALQSMDEALRLQPSDPAALFNRAILYERLYFYGRALADWEQFQKIEPDPGWREEAGDRLRKLRSHMSNPGSI